MDLSIGLLPVMIMWWCRREWSGKFARKQEMYLFANEGENHTNNVKQLEAMKKGTEDAVCFPIAKNKNAWKGQEGKSSKKGGSCWFFQELSSLGYQYPLMEVS